MDAEDTAGEATKGVDGGVGEAGAKPKLAKVPVAPPDGVELLTVPETAYVQRCGVDFVYRRIRDGSLASTAVGSKRFVKRSEVAAYFDRNTTVRRPEAESEAARAKSKVRLRELGWDGTDF